MATPMPAARKDKDREEVDFSFLKYVCFYVLFPSPLSFFPFLILILPLLYDWVFFFACVAFLSPQPCEME